MKGPLTDADAMTAAFSLSRLEVSTRATAASGVQNVALHNDGPISITFARSIVKVERARVIRPETDIALAGSAGTRPGRRWT